MLAFHYDTIDSTNEEAKRLFQLGKLANAVLGNPAYVLAQSQTAGRGTQGRVWVSPRGAGIYLTIVHVATPATPLPVMQHYTQMVGLACLETLKTLFDIQISLKPVNDLYAQCPDTKHPKKLGGILVESHLQDNQLNALMTGIGINLLNVERPLSNHNNAHPDILPISLEEILSSEFSNTSALYPTFIDTLVSQVDMHYQALIADGWAEWEAKYQAACIQTA